MKRYLKEYMEYFGYTPDDVVTCEVCSAISSHVHHIKFRSQQGTDNIENLICLCVHCHNKAHGIGGKLTEKEFMKYHKIRMDLNNIFLN